MQILRALDKQVYLPKVNFQEWLLITLILLVATGLRLYQLGTESLWTDEVHSIDDVITGEGLPPANLVRPLYYLILKVWMFFGTSEAWLRLPSAIFGVISVFLVYALSEKLLNRSVGVLASLLFALSPLMIEHSQAVRMYMLSLCLGVGGSLALASLLLKPTRRLVVTWGVLRLLAIASTPINVLLFLPDFLLLSLRFNIIRLVNRFKFWFLATFLLLLPIGFSVIQRLPDFLGERQDTSFTPGGIKDILAVIVRMIAWPLNLPHVNFSIIFDITFDIFSLSVVGLIGLSLLLSNRQKPARILWIASWALIPFFSLCLFSYIKGYGYFKILRYVIFVAPYVSILVADGFLKIWNWSRWNWSRSISSFLIGVYAITISAMLFNYYSSPTRENWRGAVQTVVAQESGEPVFIFPEIFNLPFQYYYPDDLTSPQGFPTVSQWQDIPSSFNPEEFLESLPADSQRYWFVIRFFESTFPEESQVIRLFIEDNFCVDYHEEFHGSIEVLLVETGCSDSSSQ
jgi:4-amino-4-deoxy-L-arabinose transferase-like glycosyltransferase